MKKKIKKIAQVVFIGLACLSLPMAGAESLSPGDALQVFVCTGSLVVFVLSAFLAGRLSD